MADSVGEIGLDLVVNTSDIEKTVNKAASNLASKFSASFSKTEGNAKKSFSKIRGDIKETENKIVDDTDETGKKIKAILDDTTRSAKSKAASMAAVYKSQGMDSSDAMKKAWSQIERSSDTGSNKVGRNSKKAASEMEKSFSGASGKISGTVKKLAAAFAGAFAVTQVVNFSKECLDLGSDLAEVQNVVDVTFPSMSSQIDSFAKNAAASFGLSETMAKKFTGTFGSMAEAFGFNESAAADMATTLTGLAGDVASFYNLSQDEAYTKLKSVFTGETESLKDLGVVMTQTALDAFAMANGFGKTTSAMTEAEKVSLRYAFVQDQLANAQGDFARTSDGWANQVRVLALQFDSLKASIGQGLINVLTPVIKAINTLMGKLVGLASQFKAVTEMFGGKKSGDSSGIAAVASAATDAGSGIRSAANSATALEKNTMAAGKAAKKTAKQMLGLAGFDELNNLSSSKDSSDSTDSTAGAGGGTVATQNIAASAAKGNKELGKMDKLMKGVASKAKSLAGIFKKGFMIGLGDTSVLDSLKEELDSIKRSIRDIFSAKGLQSAISNFVTSAVSALGKIAGSIVSVGLTIADALVGGIAKYLAQHKGDLIDDLSAMFNVEAQIADMVGNFAVAVADIFSVFRTDDAKQIIADFINVFVDSFINMRLLARKLTRDTVRVITQPFIDNVKQFKTAIANTLAPVSQVIHSISDAVTSVWDEVQSVYDASIAPFMESFASMISDLFRTALDSYNKYMAPVIQMLSSHFSDIVTNTIAPALKTIVQIIGTVVDTIRILMNVALKPLLKWAIKFIIPVLASLFMKFGTAVMTTFDVVTGVISGMLSTLKSTISAVKKVLSGIIDFITGTFQGDWGKAWKGIVGIFEGIIGGIAGIIKQPLNVIVSTINALISAINSISIDIPDWMPGKLGGKSFSLDIPRIPKLAEGGYVKANTPQLAMIGDNRRQGEVVAPEDKLQSMVDSAVSQAQSNTLGGIVPVLERLCNAIIELENGSSGGVDLKKYKEGDLLKVIKKENDTYKKTHGASALA